MTRYESSMKCKLPDAKKMEQIRKKYREALLRVGKSPDYHIFDISAEFLSGLRDSKAKRFLLSLRRYFFSLKEEDRRIFVMDILENGRHYPFWYMEDFSRREYESRLNYIAKGVSSCLG